MLTLKRCFHTNGFQFHQFTSLILYSTSSNDGPANPLMLQFLVNSVGFSEDEAVSIVTNCKFSHRFNSLKKSQMVLDFLKRSGFDDTHIRKLVTAYPLVLRSDVGKTLDPKIRCFQELGFSGSDLGVIVSRHPQVFKWSLNDRIVPVLEMWKSVIGSNQQLVSAMLRSTSPRFLANCGLMYFRDNVLLLQSYGVPMEKVKWLCVKQPNLLWRRTEWVEKIVKEVEEKLGILRTCARFLQGVVARSQTSDHKFEQWRQVFLSCGWSEADVLKLLRRRPAYMGYCAKALRVKLRYFMEDAGYESDYLAKHPVLLSYSMEKRILPRTAVIQALKERQLLKRDVSVYTFMQFSESKFMEKYVLPVRDELPELYEYYTRRSAGSRTKS